MEGHEGEASLRVRFKLTDAAQAGNARGLQRCAPSSEFALLLAEGCKAVPWPVMADVPGCRDVTSSSRLHDAASSGYPRMCSPPPAWPHARAPPRCRAKSMRHSLAKPASQWYVLKLSSMSTIMREWAAIHCIAHMPLREVLLTAKVGAGITSRWFCARLWWLECCLKEVLPTAKEGAGWRSKFVAVAVLDWLGPTTQLAASGCCSRQRWQSQWDAELAAYRRSFSACLLRLHEVARGSHHRGALMGSWMLRCGQLRSYCQGRWAFPLHPKSPPASPNHCPRSVPAVCSPHRACWRRAASWRCRR